MREAIEKHLLLLLAILSIPLPLLIGHSQEPPQETHSRSIVIVPTYVTICLLGVVAILHPSTCSRDLRSQQSLGITDRPSSSRKLLNHHPPCDGFKSHEFSLARRSLCAGCTGVTVGAVLSSTLVFRYFNMNWRPLGIAESLVAFGVLLVTLELAQTMFLEIGSSIFRFIFNVFFIIGVSTILIGEDMLRMSLQVDLYILVLALLWLYIRIRASQLNHQRICGRCSLTCPIHEPAHKRVRDE